MPDVYGINNCDTVKKTITWLKKQKIAYTFHDFKSEGVSAKKLEEWINKAGLEIVLNKKSTTWRSLPFDIQNKMTNKREAIKNMQTHTSIIKRPVVEMGDHLVFGFDETAFINIFTR